MHEGMGQDVELGCRCGEVHGWVRGVTPSTVNRGVCYCDDCQAFLHYLGRSELMDALGGTDIVQVAPRSVTFDRGVERIAAVRLGPKGLHRWYASCCKTPLGNTLTPIIPFVGMGPEVFRGVIDAGRRDEVFGPVRGASFAQYAIGGIPDGATKFPLGFILSAVRRILGWKLGGKAWPHPFFDRATRAPAFPVTTLPPEEREALRAKCGPAAGAVKATSSHARP